MTTDSQKRRILTHLLMGKTLTNLQGFKLYGTLRTAARISDLRADGYPISVEMVEINGKRVARYWINASDLAEAREQAMR